MIQSMKVGKSLKNEKFFLMNPSLIIKKILFWTILIILMEEIGNKEMAAEYGDKSYWFKLKMGNPIREPSKT